MKMLIKSILIFVFIATHHHKKKTFTHSLHHIYISWTVNLLSSLNTNGGT